MRINEINKQLNKILGEDIELVNVDNSPEVKQQKELNESYDTFRRIANVEAKDNQLNEWFDGVEEQKDKHDAKKHYEKVFRECRESNLMGEETEETLNKLASDLDLSVEEKKQVEDDVYEEEKMRGINKEDTNMGEGCGDKHQKESDETVKAESKENSKENSKEKTLEESVDFNALFEEEEKKKILN